MGNDTSFDDLALVRRFRTGEGEALRELIDRYDRLVRFAIFRLCKSECRRDGLFLDARASETWSGFVESVRRREAPPPKNLSSYLLQIARNKCTDALRRGGRQVLPLDDASAVAAPAEGGLDTLVRAEEVLALRGCVGLLSEDEQTICAHVDLILDGRWTRVGEALGVPESTLRTRWRGIITRLRSCVEGKTGKSFAPPPGGPDS